MRVARRARFEVLLKVALVALVALVAAFLAACSDGGGSTQGTDETSPSPPPSSSETTSAPPERGNAIFFGSSYFVGAGGITTAEESMGYLAGTQLGYRHIEVRGGGGTGFVAANPDYDLPAYKEQIQQGALRGDGVTLVVLEGGRNDVAAPLGEVTSNARDVLRLAREQQAQALLVLVGPLDVDGEYGDTDPVREVLQQVADEAGVPFIDPQRWMEGHFDLVAPDGIHPTAEGHRILGQKLADALGELGA